MGRPIKSVFFGNRNPEGVGGEGVLSANVSTAGSGYFAANAAVTFSAPQIAGGARATGTVTLNGNGSVTGITITSAGSGYTSAPTASITGANASPASAGTITLYPVTTRANAIIMTANLLAADGGSSAVSSDIVAQKGSKRYRVRNAQGTGVVSLVANGSPAAGQGYISATDSAGGSYFVKKLDERVVVVKPNTGTQFAEDAKVQWTLGSATANVSVKLGNS